MKMIDQDYIVSRIRCPTVSGDAGWAGVPSLNPRNDWLFDEKFHVDIAVNQAEFMAGIIVEEMSMGDMMTLLKLCRGQFLLVEEIIPAGAQVIGRSIMDLNLPEECVIAGVIRQGKMIVPRGVTTVEAGDEILAVTNRAGAEALAVIFGSHTHGAPGHVTKVG